MNNSGFEVQTKAMRLLLISLLFQGVSLVLYGFTGVTEFTPALSARVIGFSAASLALGIAVLIGSRLVREGSVLYRLMDLCLYLVYGFGLLAWLFYLTSEVNYIANILVAIDGTSLSAVFLLTTVFFLIAWIMALLSAISYGRNVKKAEA